MYVVEDDEVAEPEGKRRRVTVEELLQEEMAQDRENFEMMSKEFQEDEDEEHAELAADLPDEDEPPGEAPGPVAEDEESAEARIMRTKVPPKAPSIQAWREHQLMHLPFRSWCPHCVAGKAVDDAHRARHPEADAEGPEFHFDYCFLRNRAGEKSLPVLVGKDRRTKCFLAHAVPGKGAKEDWIAKQVERDIKRFGYRGSVRVMIRSDGEPAIKTLMAEVARARGDAPTMVENSPPSDSRANGTAERAVRSVEEQVRVLKIAFECNTGEELSQHHPGMAWLVEHAADTLNKGVVGKDGRTAFERAKMRAYHGEMYEFGSVVHGKIPGKPKGGG